MCNFQLSSIILLGFFGHFFFSLSLMTIKTGLHGLKRFGTGILVVSSCSPTTFVLEIEFSSKEQPLQATPSAKCLTFLEESFKTRTGTCLLGNTSGLGGLKD